MNIPENDIDQFNDLVLRFLSGENTADDLNALEAKMNASKEYRKLFEESKTTWNLSSSYLSRQKSPEANDSWKKTEHVINKSFNLPKNIFLKTILKNAALWIVLLGVGALLMQLFNKNISTPKHSLCEITTPLGSKSHITLPDGTEVWLNAGTSLRYPNNFEAGQRDVYLTGEAYFKVTTNKKRPFIVHTAEINIKALGTAFNVTAYPTDKAVVTTLVEGIVKIESNSPKAKNLEIYTLKPKTRLTYLKKTETSKNSESKASPKEHKIVTKESQPISKLKKQVIISENINTELSTSWKDARWIIKGEQIDNLAVLLERRFDVKIKLHSIDLNKYKFSGIIENETLEQVLNYLKLANPIKYAIKKGQVDIFINETTNENYKKYLK